MARFVVEAPEDIGGELVEGAVSGGVVGKGFVSAGDEDVDYLPVFALGHFFGLFFLVFEFFKDVIFLGKRNQ